MTRDGQERFRPTIEVEQERAEVWMPKGYPRMIMSPEFSCALRFHPKEVGYPYPEVRVEVNDPKYKGPIGWIISHAGDPGGGGYPYVLRSYLLLNQFNQEVANVIGGEEIYLRSRVLTPQDIANAIEALRNALGESVYWNTVQQKIAEVNNPYGYLILGLYRPVTRVEIETRNIPQERIVKDESGYPRILPDGRFWVITGNFHSLYA